MGFSQGRYQPLLGTDVHLQVWADQQSLADEAQEAALAEILRLQGVFSVFDPSSEISRWRRGEAEAGGELARALAQAAQWFTLGGGSFHPACRALRDRWEWAAQIGVMPTRHEMQALADSLAALPWRVIDGRIERTGDCSGADLNAFAKGWIVDRAVGAATALPGVTRVGVNAGGDLRHHGEGSWTVRLEEPTRPNDNGADRLLELEVCNQALATSGLARRGVRVAGQWFGHVIDPRTGWPVEHLAQVSVLAPDAATADALATICGVLPVEEALALVEGQEGCRAWIVGADGVLLTTHRLPLTREPPAPPVEQDGGELPGLDASR